MSIAVAVRKDGQTVVAADTQTNFGDAKVPVDNHRSAKILRVGPSYVATTGWGIYENLLQDYLARRTPPRLADQGEIFDFFLRFWKELRRRYSFVNDQPDQNDHSPFANLDSSFLVVNRSGIFHVSGNMTVTVFDRYYAIGSGAEYALGALHALYGEPLDAETLARRACEAAIAFDVYCGGEIEVRNV